MRARLVDRWTTRDMTILDVGIGCGSFVEHIKWQSFRPAFGTDINPVAIEWLKERQLLVPPNLRANVLTFWDTLEHIPEPYELFHFHQPKWIFVAMPIYKNQSHIFHSKHYRPGEHCWYFTERGLRQYFEAYGYALREVTAQEIVYGGREDIWSFAFQSL